MPNEGEREPPRAPRADHHQGRIHALAAAPAEPPGLLRDRLGGEVPGPRRRPLARALAEGRGSALPDVARAPLCARGERRRGDRGHEREDAPRRPAAVRRRLQRTCDAFGDAAGVRAGQRALARNDRTRGSHSGYRAFFRTCAVSQNGRAVRRRAKTARRGRGWPGGRVRVTTPRKKNSPPGPSMAWRV
jgi:hypothetical protein